MKTKSFVITTFLTFSILLTACNVSSDTTPTLAGTGIPVIQPTEILDDAPSISKNPTTIPLLALTVTVGQDARVGSFLIDDQGRTLYLHATERMNVSTCTGECAKEWTPVTIADGVKVMAGSGVDATKLGKVSGVDGVQVTYNGWPLYYYNKDSHPGNISGQGQNDFFIISPLGDKIEQ